MLFSINEKEKSVMDLTNELSASSLDATPIELQTPEAVMPQDTSDVYESGDIEE